jgi:hypothetical protein
MINLQVDDLDGVLDRLTDEGVTVDPKREGYDLEDSAGSPTQKEIVLSFGSLCSQLMPGRLALVLTKRLLGSRPLWRNAFLHIPLRRYGNGGRIAPFLHRFVI